MREEPAPGDKKIEVAPTPATTPGAEGRKGVSWGTVKTHRVYVIDSDGDDNGSEVSSSIATMDLSETVSEAPAVRPDHIFLTVASSCKTKTLSFGAVR